MDITLLTLLFISVNFDFFIILLYLLHKYRFKEVLIGYGTGIVILWISATVLSQTLHFFLPNWLFGFLGLIPLYMALHGESDADGEDEPNHSSKYSGILAVLVIYLGACGPDNFAIYVPVLSNMNLSALIFGGMYILILMMISTVLAAKFGRLPKIKHFFDNYGEITT